jgi:hypothetical protein
MAEKADKPAPVVVEQIPSVEGGISAIGSLAAPIIFFDGVATMGHYNGIAHFCLTALRFLHHPDGVKSDSVIAAHLRMNLVALKALKEAIEKVQLMVEPVPEGKKN